jgi:hypothetical protein
MSLRADLELAMALLSVSRMTLPSKSGSIKDITSIGCEVNGCNCWLSAWTLYIFTCLFECELSAPFRYSVIDLMLHVVSRYTESCIPTKVQKKSMVVVSSFGAFQMLCLYCLFMEF